MVVVGYTPPILQTKLPEEMEDKLLEACTAEIVTALPNVVKAQGAAEAKNEVGHV